MLSNIIGGEAVGDSRDSDSCDRVPRGPAIYQGPVVGLPGDAGGKAGQVDFIGGGGREGDAQQERGGVNLDASEVSNLHQGP